LGFVNGGSLVENTFKVLETLKISAVGGLVKTEVKHPEAKP